MSEFVIWHNPRCSKSRAALARLQERGVEPEVVRYLDDPPSQGEIEQVLKMLGFDDPRQLMRTKEKVYRDLKLNEAEDGALVEAMAEHPVLIERPVVIKDGKQAVLARPTEALDILLA